MDLGDKANIYYESKTDRWVFEYKLNGKWISDEYLTLEIAKQAAVDFAIKHGVKLTEKNMNTEYFKGKNVVVTGAFPKYGTRTVVEDMLRKMGANVQAAVVSTTDFLICGDKVGARKTQAAEVRSVKMLNRADFEAIVNATPEAPVVVKPKLTHEEYIASIPENYGGW